MSALFPGAADLASFWQNLVEGRDAITDAPADRWDPVYYDPESTGPDRFYCRRGGFLGELATFDPQPFGIMPNAVDGVEPDQLLALRVARAALDDAGGDRAAPVAERTGVVVGRGGYLTPGVARLDQRVRTVQQLVESVRSLVPEIDDRRLAEVKNAFVGQLAPDRPESAIDLVPNLVASRIANRLDLHGPAYTVDGACASSLLAVDAGVRELRSGRCDLVLAGGVHLCHDVTLWSVFTQLRALSPTQQIRPFDRRADGLLIGEGAGMVALKRLEDAERDGDRIYAVLCGLGVSSDGREVSLMKPSAAGQLLALERAWSESGLDPDSCGLVEAHGTATPTGDAAELETLARFFGPPASGDGAGNHRGGPGTHSGGGNEVHGGSAAHYPDGGSAAPLPRRRQCRGRLGEVDDRPCHACRRGRRPHQGRAGPPSRDCAADPALRRTRSQALGDPLPDVPDGARLGRRSEPASGGGQRLRLRGDQYPRRAPGPCRCRRAQETAAAAQVGSAQVGSPCLVVGSAGRIGSAGRTVRPTGWPGGVAGRGGPGRVASAARRPRPPRA